MLKIVHLTSVHSEDDSRIFHKQCHSLADSGYDVTLIAPGAQRNFRSGVKLVGVPKALNRRQRMTRTVHNVYKAAIAENGDLYHFHDPELIPIGIKLKLKGKRVVYDVHEDFPKQKLSTDWLPKGMRWIVGRGIAVAEAIGAAAFDGIVAATPMIAKKFPKRKTVTVRNYPILEELQVANAAPFKQRSANVLYFGCISAVRGVRQMVDAVSMLPNELNVRFLLAGGICPPSFKDELKRSSGWERVLYLGWCTRPQLKQHCANGQVGLVTLLPTRANVEILPTKLFEYMSAGLPVIVSDFPICREIVEEAECGIVIDPENTKAIADAIEWVLRHPNESEEMGLRGLKAVRRKYNWESEYRVLLEFYESILCDNHVSLSEELEYEEY